MHTLCQTTAVLLLSFLLSVGTAFGQTANNQMSQLAQLKKLRYAGYVKASQILIKEAVAEGQAVLKANPDCLECRFELAETQYLLLNQTMRDQDRALFNQHNSPLEKHLDALWDADFRKGDLHAMYSGLYGLRIAYAPWKGMLLGSSAASQAQKGPKADPQSGFAWKQWASNLFHTPEMWGGDPEKALEYFGKAVSLFEEQGQTAQNYRYLDAIMWLAIAQQKQGQPAAATATLRKALQAEPQFGWAKGMLMGLQATAEK